MGTVKNELGDNYGAPFSYFFIHARAKGGYLNALLGKKWSETQISNRESNQEPYNARPWR